FLSMNAAIQVERRRQLLWAALWRSPGDKRLLQAMGVLTFLDGNAGLDEAGRWTQGAGAANPARRGFHTNLGATLYKKGKVDEAIAWLRKALEITPNNSTALINLGTALYARGQEDEAIACFQKAMKLAPWDSAPHNHLGVVLLRSGQ